MKNTMNHKQIINICSPYARKACNPIRFFSLAVQEVHPK